MQRVNYSKQGGIFTLLYSVLKSSFSYKNCKQLVLFNAKLILPTDRIIDTARRQ